MRFFLSPTKNDQIVWNDSSEGKQFGRRMINIISYSKMKSLTESAKMSFGQNEEMDVVQIIRNCLHLMMKIKTAQTNEKFKEEIKHNKNKQKHEK